MWITFYLSKGAALDLVQLGYSEHFVEQETRRRHAKKKVTSCASYSISNRPETMKRLYELQFILDAAGEITINPNRTKHLSTCV